MSQILFQEFGKSNDNSKYIYEIRCREIWIWWNTEFRCEKIYIYIITRKYLVAEKIICMDTKKEDICDMNEVHTRIV